MIRILYMSAARPGIKEADILTITKNASRANRAREISGALAFNGRGFCQCLEGQRDAVHDLLNTIRQDNRHSEVTLIAELKITERYYKGWDMHWVFDLNYSDVQASLGLHSRL